MMSMNLRDIAFLNIKVSNYCCIISEVRKKWRHKLNAKYQFDRKRRKTVKNKNLLSRITMGKEVLTFGDIKVEKNKFYRNKAPIFF